MTGEKIHELPCAYDCNFRGHPCGFKATTAQKPCVTSVMNLIDALQRGIEVHRGTKPSILDFRLEYPISISSNTLSEYQTNIYLGDTLLGNIVAGIFVSP